MSEPPAYFLIQFTPDHWTILRKLTLFVGPPLPDDGNVRFGLRDCEKHLIRAAVYQRIADRLRSNLPHDREEMKEYGGTDNVYSQEYAAICESIVTTFYSALDGLRTFIFGTYRNVQGVQNGSNGKLFERAKLQKYGAGFPVEIQALLTAAHDDWFIPLRQFRTELTHGSTGSCHLDEATGLIRYFNDGIKVEGKPFMLDDIDGYISNLNARVHQLVEAIADFHYQLLEAIPKFAMCGMYKYRWYGRMVAPTQDLNFSSGHCMSYDWFEKTDGYFCPLASQCGAYTKKWPGGSKPGT